MNFIFYIIKIQLQLSILLRYYKMDFTKFERDLVSLIAQVKPGLEFEIRFGNFYKNKDPSIKRKNFQPNYDINFLLRLQNLFKEYPSTRTLTTDYTYKIASFNKVFRKTVDLNGAVTWMEKHKLQEPRDIYDYNMRFALNSETFVQAQEGGELVYTRVKDRTSFLIDNIGSLDLTTSKSEGQISYEVELEIYPGADVTLVKKCIEFILQQKQQNQIVISEYEKNNVLYYYKNAVNNWNFVGSQPETLQKDQLSNLYKEMYSVTDKADGERALMIINESGKVYFVDSNVKNVIKTNLVSTSTNCILDGELIRNKDVVDFYAFDMFFINGQDIRDNQEWLLDARLTKVKQTINSISTYKNQQEMFTVHAKQFIYRNVFLGAEIIMSTINDKPYSNDGVIFTPMNEPYLKTRKCPKLLKWKPSELNSIDFYSVKNQDNKTWNLYVLKPVENNSKTIRTQEKVLFDVNVLCGTDKVSESYITYQTTFNDNLIDPVTNSPFESNTVIEYSWDSNNKLFVPIRSRPDKTANPDKHGNNCHVACNIWNSINNPVTKENLFQMTNGSGTSEMSGFFFKDKKI